MGVEEGAGISESEVVAQSQSPRHAAQLVVREIIEEWGVAGFDNDGLSDPLPPVRIVARRLVDGLEEAMARSAYERGVIDGATYGPRIAGSRSKFEEWWLNR